MSLKSKIEAVIYASEEPVTLLQLVGLLAGEAQTELDEIAANQASLPLNGEENGDATPEDRVTLDAGTHEGAEGITGEEQDVAVSQALEQGDVEVVQAGEEVVREETSAGTPEASESEPAAVSEESAAPEEPVASAAPGETQDAADAAPETAAEPSTEADKKLQRDRERAVRDHIRWTVDTLIREYAETDRGIEIREVASGFRMGTKPEFHDAVRGFVKSLKPALKLTLPALETLAVVAYKQPVTAAEISEIRGVDSAGVLGGLMTRKLIATAGRKQVIGRPMLYKTTRDFLLRFGLKDVNELPSMEEFERMAGELAEQEDLPMEGADGLIEEANARGDAEHIREMNGEAATTEAADEAAEAEATVYAEGVEAAEEPAEIQALEEEIEQENEKATAETAAGGNDEEVHEEHTGESEAAVTEHAAEPEAAAESGEAATELSEAADGASEEPEEPQTAG